MTPSLANLTTATKASMKNEDDQVADDCFALKQSVDYGYQIEPSLLFKIIQK